MTININSPFAYNSYLPSPGANAFASYAEVEMLTGDAYKELQYWLSVYNYAQTHGGNNLNIADITAQITRVNQKLNYLQTLFRPAAEGRMNYENTTNQGVASIFQNQQ